MNAFAEESSIVLLKPKAKEQRITSSRSARPKAPSGRPEDLISLLMIPSEPNDRDLSN